MSLFSKLFLKNNKSATQNKQDKFAKHNQDVVNNFSSLIGCECTLISRSTSNEQLTQLFISELETGRRNGYVPIVLTSEANLIQTIEGNYNNNGQNFRENIIKNLDISQGEEILKSNLTELLKNSENIAEDIYGQEYIDIKKNPKLYDELSNPVNSPIYEENTDIFIARIPTDKPWEVLAWIPFGGWNECPNSKDMTTICKYWFEKFGAIPAVITSDTMQFYVPNPIKNHDDALRLAEEHFAFCPDNVFQGTGTIKALSSLIIDSKIWHFWWD